MRKWLYSTVVAILNANGQAQLAGRVLSSSAYGSEGIDAPARPFIVIRAGLSLPEEMGPELRVKKLGRHPFTIWVHDEPGSFVVIDDTLSLIQKELAVLSYPVTSGGWVVREARWQNDSDDLYDDGFRTAVRNSEYQLVGREV